ATVRRRGPAHLRRCVPGGRGDGGRRRGRGRWARGDRVRRRGRGSGADGVGGGDGEGVGGAVGQSAHGGAGRGWATGHGGRCLRSGPDERGDRVTGDRTATVRRRGPAHLRRCVPGGRG